MESKAKELSEICNNGSCTISAPENDITNSAPFSTKNGIEIKTQIQTFINRSTIKATKINVDSNGNYIANFYNYGRIETTDSQGSLQTNSVQDSGYKNIYNYGFISSYVYLSQNETGATNLVNYGEMGGMSGNQNNQNKPVTIDNRGVINLFQQNGSGKKIHFKQLGTLTLQNYAMQIRENQATFNGFSGNAIDNSHLVLDSVTSVSFADASAKMILDFGGDFEVGKGYALNKLIVDATNGSNKLSVEFSRLIPRSDLFSLSQSGEYFIATLNTKASTIRNLYKSNIRTMNNFLTISNSMIYPRKYNFVILRERSDRRISKNISSLRASEYERGNPQKQRTSQNLAQNPHDYYFILTPFINHNLFFESGRYNLSGLEYGFLTAFSGKITPSNVLGTHFMMSYGTIGDSKDKDFSITNLNLNIGLNYKLDLIYDMFIKARSDFFYFLNQVKTLTMLEAIKPNNMGFGLSVAYGKDFNFGNGGVLGLEAGIDYKALQSGTISLHDNIYQKALYNLLYADLGVSYAKYFGNFGLNAGLGIKGNITANKLAISQIRISALDRNVDMVLDNDKILGYANISASYVLNHKDFDMEFSLAYYGNYGDRIISNAGGFEWRVVW